MENRKNTLYFIDFIVINDERINSSMFHEMTFDFFIPCLLFILSRILFQEMLGLPQMNSILLLLFPHNIFHDGSIFSTLFLKFILNAKENIFNIVVSKKALFACANSAIHIFDTLLCS